MKDKTSLPADQVGEALHTALRKNCDSAPTTYAWNIIHLLTGTWSAYCAAVATADAKTGADLKTVFDSDGWWPRESAFGENHYTRQIFRISLEDFDEDDWEGFASYLTSQP